MKKFLILILSIGFVACSSDTATEQKLGDCVFGEIVGQWKLIKSEQMGIDEHGEFKLFTSYYNLENVIYDFQDNGILIISGGQNPGYSAGEYAYIFEEDYIGYPIGNEPKVWQVEIGQSNYLYNCVNGTMILGQSYVDGTDLFFKRILE
ncbi:MAG TPA: hypothetical protein VFM82_01280 [Flavobacteriaceae bacterium]|nr:hypothetical protein [Flavobacteriaceae bacterium]